MTHDRDIERILDTWFTDGPTETPDRVLDDVESRIHRQTQRPAWRLTWRQTPMNAYLKPLAAIAAAVVIAIAGFALLSRPSGIAAPTTAPVLPSPTQPSTSATLSPSASPIDCRGGTGCAGPLAAGAHRTVAFSVPFTFTTPDGWVNNVDLARSYRLQTASGLATSIQLFAMVAIADQSPACDAPIKAGADTSVQGIIDYVRTSPALVAKAPAPVALAGYTGQSIDFTVATTWTGHCPALEAVDPFFMMLTDTGTPKGRAVGYSSRDGVRWLVLDIKGSTLIVELLGSPVMSQLATEVAAAQPVLDTIAFTP